MKITWVYFLLSFVFLSGFVPLSGTLAQPHTVWVSGKVLNEKDKTPLAGISVFRKKTGEGVATDDQGNFRIRIETSDTLVFRGIGFLEKNYIPSLRSATELRVNMLLQETSVQLKTVEVGPGLDPEKVDRAVRNMKPRASSSPKMGPGVPKVIVAPTKPSSKPPSALTAVANPATFLYESFSKDAKSRRRVIQLTEEQEKERKQDSVRQARLRYNRFFQDTTSFRE